MYRVITKLFNGIHAYIYVYECVCVCVCVCISVHAYFLVRIQRYDTVRIFYLSIIITHIYVRVCKCVYAYV